MTNHFQKNHYDRFVLTMGLCFLAMVLSGLGYPNENTLIVGTDEQEGQAPFYDLRFEGPDSILPGEVFEVRLSVEHDDEHEITSTAKLSLTGGRLLNDQQQELIPDAVWRIEASKEDALGVVVNVESSASANKDSELLTEYIDTISKKYNISSQNVYSEDASLEAADFDSENNTSLVAVFSGSVVVLLGAAFYLWTFLQKKKY